MCTYILSWCFLSVVLSALSQRQLFWSLYDWYPSIIAMDLEYLIQKFAINGAFFLTKEQRLFLWLLFFWLGYISSDNKYLAGCFFFITEYERRYCFLTALLAVSCALFLWCCPRGYPGGEEPVWEMMSVRLSFVWALSFKASTTRLTSSLFWSPIFVMSMVM